MMTAKSAAVFLFSLAVWAGAAGADVTREEYTSPLETGTRPRRTPHTLIYARFQPYDLGGNYRDEWYDRPLFVNSLWRDASRRGESWKKEAELLKKYEIAGVTVLGNAYASFNREVIARSEQGDFSGLDVMAGLGWPRSEFDGKTPASEKLYQRMVRHIRETLDGKNILHIDGKIPFFCYGGTTDSGAHNLRTRLKKDGLDSRVQLFAPLWLNVYGEFNNTGKLSQETLKKMESVLREKLDVYDGFNFTNCFYTRNLRGDDVLGKVFRPELDKKYLAPLFSKVYADPKYRGKLLGFTLDHGYIGDIDNGVNQAECGTAVLRRQIDTQLLYDPDIISLAEWNEVNENTCFQPTLTNSWTIRRLIRFYARFLKGLPPAPCEGDDLSIPDLVVSVRWNIQAGEEYRIELLNIPDTPEEGTYRVALSLTDENGKLLRKMGEDTFRRNKLTAVTYKVNAEAWHKRVRAVIPQLEITYKGRTFRMEPAVFTRLSAVTANNAKELRLPLRDQWTPGKFVFSALPRPDGSVRIKAEAAGKELLNSLEVLDGKFTAVSAWPEDGLKQADHYWIAVKCHRRYETIMPFRIRVAGTGDYRWRPWGRPYCSPVRLERDKEGWFGSPRCHFWHSGPAGMDGIPKNDCENAVIECVIGNTPAVRVPFADLRKKRVTAAEPGDCVQLELELRDELPDHPAPLNSKRAAIDACVFSKMNDPMYSVLAVTAEGKIFRSRPVFIRKIERTAPLRIYSTTAKKAVTAEVPAFQIPDIRYKFSPEYGNILGNDTAKEFDATLGGGLSRGQTPRRGALPRDLPQMAPIWEKTADGYSLKFTGGSYLSFPAAAVPNGAFTLEMELKTDSSANQYLFFTGQDRQGAVGLAVVDGKLHGSYGSGSTGFGHVLTALPTDIAVTPGVWHTVKVAYDLEHIRFEVDGKGQTMPLTLRPAWTAPSLFGNFFTPASGAGFAKPGPFTGHLRKLRILHNAKVDPPKIREVKL